MKKITVLLITFYLTTAFVFAGKEIIENEVLIFEDDFFGDSWMAVCQFDCSGSLESRIMVSYPLEAEDKEIYVLFRFLTEKQQWFDDLYYKNIGTGELVLTNTDLFKSEIHDNGFCYTVTLLLTKGEFYNMFLNGDRIYRICGKKNHVDFNLSPDIIGILNEFYDATNDRRDYGNKSTVTITATVGLNVRAGPATSYKVLTKVEYKDKVEKLDSKSGWYKIKTPDGTIGWVCGGMDGEVWVK